MYALMWASVSTILESFTITCTNASTVLWHGKQKAQMSLTNHQTLLPSGEWLRFIRRIFRLLSTPLPFDALNEGVPLSYRFLFSTGKVQWLGYNLVKVAQWSPQSLGHNTSTWQTHRQQCCHSKCHAKSGVRQQKYNNTASLQPNNTIGQNVVKNKGTQNTSLNKIGLLLQ